mmetsp:Transcript_88265/g.248519  ORF Transcript_88265/g.248519 Transcript_88265/m.248519 type:complete len:353 (-) Transcript_88265:343-1401(-)
MRGGPQTAAWQDGSDSMWGGAGIDSLGMAHARKKAEGGFKGKPRGMMNGGLPPSPPGWLSPRAYQQMAASHAAHRFPGRFVPHRLCNNFAAHGWCEKADACTFAHGFQELHPEVQAQLAPQLGLDPPFSRKARGKSGGKSGMQTTASTYDSSASTYDDEYYTTKLDRNAISREKREEVERIAREIESGRRPALSKVRGRGKALVQGRVSGEAYSVFSTYDEELYTTKLDMSSVPREKREEAERIAREIVQEIEASRRATEAKASTGIPVDGAEPKVVDRPTEDQPPTSVDTAATEAVAHSDIDVQPTPEATPEPTQVPVSSIVDAAKKDDVGKVGNEKEGIATGVEGVPKED